MSTVRVSTNITTITTKSTRTTIGSVLLVVEWGVSPHLAVLGWACLTTLDGMAVTYGKTQGI